MPSSGSQQRRAESPPCRMPAQTPVHPRMASRGCPQLPIQPNLDPGLALRRAASKVCGAASVGRTASAGGWPAACLALLLACTAPSPRSPAPQTFTAPPPSQAERYCAWYGSERAGTLYFGEAAFWSSFRAAGGNPRADLALPGPQLVGRFDLEALRLRPPLDVTSPGARSGVWDVHAHPNGRVYFTTYFDPMGWVDPRSGEVTRLEQLGLGLNEIAPGPGDEMLVSRYGGDRGSVLRISPAGELLAELPLRAPRGYRAAPKTVAFDPGRSEIWVTTDLLPRADAPVRHDAYVLGLDGSERRRIESPEVQFVAFAADGSGARAELTGSELWLVRSTPGASERRILLDPAFPSGHDFAQDLQFTPDGGVVVTRWSGAIHLVGPEDQLRTLRLPRPEPDGLFYTAVAADGEVCATFCAGVSVVCAPTGG